MSVHFLSSLYIQMEEPLLFYNALQTALESLFLVTSSPYFEMVVQQSPKKHLVKLEIDILHHLKDREVHDQTHGILFESL